MPLAYRSLMTLRPGAGHDVFGLVEEHRAGWLARKRIDPAALRPGRVELAEGVVANVFDGEVDDGRTSRFTLVEQKRDGRWMVRITTHARAGADAWILIDVVAPDNERQGLSEGALPRAAPPAIVRSLLEAAELYDGATRQTSRPVLVDSGGVGEVIEAICDPERRGLVLVTGAPDDALLGGWERFVKERTKDGAGVVTAFVLDTAATAKLNASLDTHGTPTAYFRTYLPDADPASALDARRHRMMSSRTLSVRDARYVRHVIARSARAHVVDLPLRPDVAAVERLAARWETEALLDVPTAVPQVRPLAEQAIRPEESLDAEIRAVLSDAVRDVLGEDEVTAGAVELLALAAERGVHLEEAVGRAREVIGDLQGQADRARDDERQLRREIEDIGLEHEVDLERLIDLEDEVRRLRILLSKHGEGDDAWAGVPDDERSRGPESMTELLDRLGELDHIVFTGDAGATLHLDAVDASGRSAKKAWLALLALNDYAALRASNEFVGSFHDFCRETPVHCHGWSADRHAPDESEFTKRNARYKAVRTLPVPVEVHPDGEVFMGAHVKIANMGSITPRLHYFDDAARSGKVFVGYLGRHLPSARTN